ncbi:hypothetical protein [Leifsonia sp. NPDC058248]|uniref:hypothetical protein n=1 Tax=Leifsonia sp. NPDC058248 TaxID=3346402 RepID=UPI0036DB71E4
MIILAAVTSCASSPDSTTSDQSRAKDMAAMMTPEQAKQEVRALYEATRDLMPGNWFEDTRTWGTCTTASGESGAYYEFLAQRRDQPLPADPASIAEQAQRVWAAHGHPVRIQRDKTLDPPRWILSDPAWLAGTGPDGLLLQFTVGDDYADFIANSRCVAGDSVELGLNE